MNKCISAGFNYPMSDMFRGVSVTQQCRGMSYNILKTMNKVSTKESVIAFYTLNLDNERAVALHAW